MTIKEQLKEIQLAVGNVGVDKLYLEAKRKKVPGITREAVKLFLATDESKQLFKPLPESKGKTGAEAQQFRVQMDLLSYQNNPSKIRNRGPLFKFALVLIDVMSRKVWSMPLVSKEPATVEPALRRLLNGMDKLPAFLFSDQGNEFTGVVDEMLEQKGIIHKSKPDKYDINPLSVVDRAIQTIKKRLAESLAANPGSWPQRLHVVTRQYNNTQHPTIRSAPAEFGKTDGKVAEFMTLADNADKLEHNQDLLVKRKKKLADLGGFRVPISAPKTFQRGFKQRYSSDVKVLEEIKGSVAIATDGTRADVKRVLPVHAASDYAEAGFGLSDARIQRKKDDLVDMMALLMVFADEGERTSVSSASKHLRQQMGTAYKETLKKTGFDRKGGLALAIRLFDEFEVESGGFYFVKK